MTMTNPRDQLFRLDRSTIVREEDIAQFLTEGLDELSEIAAEHAAATRQDYLRQVDAADEPMVLPPFAQTSHDRLETAVRSYLEDHVLVLEEPGDDVDSSDLKRALIRQALIRLRAPVLEEIVRQQGDTPRSRQAGELALQVADSYGWDPTAVARLVLDHTEEPQATAGGWSTRVFQTKEPMDADRAQEYLGIAVRRFVQVGPVKWFAFDAMEREGPRIRLHGRLRTFVPKPNETPDGNFAVLGSESTTHSMSVIVESGSKFLRVEQATSTAAARAAVTAFAKLTLSERQAWVSGAERDAASIPGQLHPQTQFLLGIVRSKLPADQFAKRNAVLARFRIPAGGEKAGEGDTASISAWRAEGRHLLNTPSASKLLLSEGRPLVDLTFEASDTTEGEGNRLGRFATRLVLENDHVLVETGLAGASEHQTLAAHRAAVSAVEEALVDGIPAELVSQLAEEMRRNESGEATSGPSILDESAPA